MEVSEFIVENSIRNKTQLLAQANLQKEAGKKDLANFLLARSSKHISDLLENTWEMESASEELMKHDQPRMEVVSNHAMRSCTEQCDGVWFRLAKELLENNNINVKVFSCALRELFQYGRGKYRNIFIVGPANCG